jgi:hypothetical protein
LTMGRFIWVFILLFLNAQKLKRCLKIFFYIHFVIAPWSDRRMSPGARDPVQIIATNSKGDILYLFSAPLQYVYVLFLRLIFSHKTPDSCFTTKFRPGMTRLGELYLQEQAPNKLISLDNSFCITSRRFI